MNGMLFGQFRVGIEQVGCTQASVQISIMWGVHEIPQWWNYTLQYMREQSRHELAALLYLHAVRTSYAIQYSRPPFRPATLFAKPLKSSEYFIPCFQCFVNLLLVSVRKQNMRGQMSRMSDKKKKIGTTRRTFAFVFYFLFVFFFISALKAWIH